MSTTLDHLLAPIWFVAIAWAVASVLVWFFVIGPHLPDRGATPIAGASVPWFGRQHRAQLEAYRLLCIQQGTTLMWWRLVRAFLVAWPILLFVLVVFSLVAVRA